MDLDSRNSSSERGGDRDMSSTAMLIDCRLNHPLELISKFSQSEFVVVVLDEGSNSIFIYFNLWHEFKLAPGVI